MRLIYDWIFGIEEVIEEEIKADQTTIDNRNKLLKEIRDFDNDLLVPSQPPIKIINKKLFKRKRNRIKKK